MWKKLTEYKVDANASHDVRKFHMLVNQSLLIGLLLFVLVVSAFIAAWLVLIHHDIQKYWNHIYGIYIALGIGFTTTIAFIFQDRFGDFENVYFFSGVTYHSWTTSICVFYGPFFGFEYFTLVIAGIGCVGFWRKRRFVVAAIGFSLVNLLTIRTLYLYYAPLYPIDYEPVRIAFYYLSALTVFAVVVIFFIITTSQGIQAERSYIKERDKADQLLLNILPEAVANELKEKGKAEARDYAHASVLFTDFIGFTAIAEKMTPVKLLQELDFCFSEFDRICDKYDLERLKTVGDAFMACAGLPEPNPAHAIRCVRAAIEMRDFMAAYQAQKKKMGEPSWDVRIGVHSGPVVAGIVGQKKFAYDIWGDTVNLASRMESAAVAGQVNISRTTYDLVKTEFRCEARGEISIKNRGTVEMFTVL
jgi:class 3 adenylate cyclase